MTALATGPGPRPGRELPTKLGVCLTRSPTGGRWKGEGCRWVPPGAAESPPALFSWAGRATGGAAALDQAGGFQSPPPLASGHLVDVARAWQAQPTPGPAPLRPGPAFLPWPRTPSCESRGCLGPCPSQQPSGRAGGRRGAGGRAQLLNAPLTRVPTQHKMHTAHV